MMLKTALNTLSLISQSNVAEYVQLHVMLSNSIALTHWYILLQVVIDEDDDIVMDTDDDFDKTLEILDKTEKVR